MELSAVSSAASAVQAQRLGDAVGLTVLRKALDVQAQGALQLLQALPQPAPVLPPHLGTTLDVTA